MSRDEAARFSFLLLVPIACKALGVPVLEFAYRSIMPSLVAAVPAGILAWWLRVFVGPASLGSIVLSGAAVGLLYVASFVVLGLRAAEDAQQRRAEEVEDHQCRHRMSGQADDREVTDDSGRWFKMTTRPYRTSDGEIRGAVITLMDISILRAAQDDG